MQQRDRLQAAVEGLVFFDPWGYQHSDTMGYQWDNGFILMLGFIAEVLG
jgi:hypothetical protein